MAIADPAACNHAITRVHYTLSQALSETIGPGVGANFHSWAVWGSKKAGVTIRQEDLESALKNATVAAGFAGMFVGWVAAYFILRLLDAVNPGLILLGGIPGALCGAWTGRLIARYSRSRAAELILWGNRTVLEDIGGQTARFVDTFESQPLTPESVERFAEGMKPGRTEEGGQDLLKRAFRAYGVAANRDLPLEERRRAAYFGNCLAIYHEHIRLQPCIAASMPWIIRHCVTQRMMHYEAGSIRLSVAQEFPAELAAVAVQVLPAGELREFLREMGWSAPENPQPVSASDWTQLPQRMRYVMELFRRYHLDSRVMSAPEF